MLPGARMFFEGGGGGALEYIETPKKDSGCKITTAVAISNDLVVNARIRVFDAGDDAFIATGWTANFLCTIEGNYGNPRFKWHTGGSFKYASFPFDTDLTVELARTYITVNGSQTTKTASQTYNQSYGPLRIFGSDTSTDRSPHVRLYSITLSKSGVEVFHGVPWMKNGVAGLYDTVGETFYPSEGADKFIAGPVAAMSS